MNHMFALLGGIAVAAGLTVTAYADDKHDAGKDQKTATIQGELIDTACFVASNGDAKGNDHAECGTKCLGSGVPAAILPEGSKGPTEIRYLLTNPTVLAPYAGQTIKIEGAEHAGMKAIDVKRLFVREGQGWKELQLKDEHHKMSGSGAPAVQESPKPAPATVPPAAQKHGGPRHKH